MATEWIGLLLVSKGTKTNQVISLKSCLWMLKNRLILSGSNTKKLTSRTHDSEQELPKWRQKYNVKHYCYTSQTLFQVCKKQTHETSVPSTKFKTFQILNRVQLLHLPLHAHGSAVKVAQKSAMKTHRNWQGSWLAHINNQPHKKMQALSVTQSKTLSVCNRKLY
jgi:thiol:disulfide interchange protein